MKEWQELLWRDFKGAWALPLAGLVLLGVAATFIQLSLWFIPVGVVGIILLIWGFVRGHMGKSDDEVDSESADSQPDKPKKEGMGIIEGWVKSTRIMNQASVENARNIRDEYRLRGVKTNTEILKATEEQASLKDVLERARELAEAGHQTSLAAERDKQLDYELRGQLFVVAASRGMDVTTYLQVVAQRETKEIDLQVRAEEYRQDQEQISRVQQEPLELIDRATHRLFSMYEQRAQIEASDDPAKEAKLGQLNYNIQIAERLIRGEQDRYLQAALGEETERALSPAQSGGDDSEEVATDRQQLPAKRGRGRPRKTPAE